jgi:hypothetical protein
MQEKLIRVAVSSFPAFVPDAPAETDKKRKE